MIVEYFEFWTGVVLGKMALLLFVMGGWVKRDFRGRPMNRWHSWSIMAQGVFTLALALHLMLQPFDLRFPYRTAMEPPLLFVGLTSIGIMIYCMLRHANEAHLTIRDDGLHRFRGQ